MALGRPKAVLVLSAPQREQLEMVGQFALAASAIGSAGAHDSDERRGDQQPGDCPSVEDHPGHGGQMAGTILGTRCGGKGTYAANAAVGTGLRRRSEARRSSAWHHHAVSGPGHGQGHGDRPMSARSWTSGVFGFSTAN